MPNHDDPELAGVGFFRTGLVAADLSNLTLPRTFFGRSEFRGVSFRNSDLSESRMCWNNFIDCDFTGADLSRCDMRASLFENCTFTGCHLCAADVRRSCFTDCDFAGADLAGAVAGNDDAMETPYETLTSEQKDVMVWQDSGPEPPGG